MMRIICLVDIYSHTIRIVRQLSNCIYNKTVVFSSIVGGNYIKAITDAEKRSHVIFVCKSIIFCNIFFAEFICHIIDLFTVFFLYSRPDVYRVFQPVDFFALRHHFFHNLCCQRCPGTIFNEADGTILVIVFYQSVNKIIHKRIDTCIVSCGCKNQF